MLAAKVKVTITFRFTVRTCEHAPILCSMYIFSNETELCMQNCGLRQAAKAQASTYIRHVRVPIVQHAKGLLARASRMQYKGRSAAIGQHQSQELLAENWS